jgi:hypothetical protein
MVKMKTQLEPIFGFDSSTEKKEWKKLAYR